MSRRENLFTMMLVWCLLSFAFVGEVCGQTSSRNYVRKAVMTAPYQSNPVIDFENARITVDYYDGLGRPIQSVNVAKAVEAEEAYSLYTIYEYDSYGKPYRTWLPIPNYNLNGDYQDIASLKQEGVDFYNDALPFSETVYDGTPDLREKTVWNPGSSWRNAQQSISKVYGFNHTDSLRLRCPLFDVASNGSLVYRGPYLTGKLRYELIRGEGENHNLIRFYDFDNRLVLERRQANGILYDTNYVYNIVGNLTYVIPPKASVIFHNANQELCDTATVKKLCYHYVYDQYDRLIEKRLPGAEPEYYVYDALDNVIFRQDGRLRAEGQWWAIKYDNLYRKATEGTAVLGNQTRSQLQETWKNKVPIETPDLTIDAEGVLFYTDTCGVNCFIPQVSYFYDNYKHWENLIGTLPTDAGYTQGDTIGTGMLTGKAVYNCFGNPMIMVYVYDKSRRKTLEARAELYGGLTHRTFYNYSFAGDLLKKKEIFWSNKSPHTTSEHYYSYHTSGDLQMVRHSYNGASPVILYTCSYDNAARLSMKSFSPRTTSPTTRVNYTRNLRGWITGITSSRFTQKIGYERVPSGGTARYDGNVGSMTFTSVNQSSLPDSVKVLYEYDRFGRLMEVNQQNLIDNDKLFSESFIYDDNGNAISITRGDDSKGLIQNLNITYDGNRISSVTESKSDNIHAMDVPSIAKGEYLSGWKYDGSGNLKADPSRGVTTIIYNAYNLPEQVVFKDGSRLYNYYFGDGEYAGSRESEKIITTVDGGSGTKVTTLTTTRKQIGNFVETNNSLNRIYIDEGYIDVFSGGAVDAEYHYYVEDYQGSVRAVVDEEGELKQSVDYTVYGVPSTRYMMNDDNRMHLGLEWQTLKGWNTYLNNARTRDPHYARFQQLDPLAEKYYPFSPYHYGINNPLKYADVNGMDIWDVDINGYVRLLQKDVNVDQINIVDKNGSPMFKNGIPISIKFDYGTIEKQYSWEGLNGGQNDFWRVRGDDNAQAMFEFMSDNITGSSTQVEIGWAKTGIKGDSGLNFITTGHKRGAEPGLSHLYGGQLQYGYTIREIHHSHPIGVEAGNDDRILKTQIMMGQFYNNKPIPKFYIYNVKYQLKLNY